MNAARSKDVQEKLISANHLTDNKQDALQNIGSEEFCKNDVIFLCEGFRENLQLKTRCSQLGMSDEEKTLWCYNKARCNPELKVGPWVYRCTQSFSPETISYVWRRRQLPGCVFHSDQGSQ